MRTDQGFVGEHAPPRQVHDWLENHPEALVTKRLVEGPGRGGNGIGRVHERQSSRRSSSGPIRWLSECGMDQPNVNANASTPGSRNSISSCRSAMGLGCRIN